MYGPYDRNIQMEKNQTAQHQIIIASSEVQAMCLQKYYSILFASTQ